MRVKHYLCTIRKQLSEFGKVSLNVVRGLGRLLRLSARVIKGVGERVGQAETGQLSESENLADTNNTDHSGNIKNVASGCDNRYEHNTLSEVGEVKLINSRRYCNELRNNAECEGNSHNKDLDGYGTGNRLAEHSSKADALLQLLRIRKETYQHLRDGVSNWFADLIDVCSQHILQILSDAIEDLTRDEDFTGERALTVSASGISVEVNPLENETVVQYSGRVIAGRLVACLGPRVVEMLVDNGYLPGWIRENSRDILNLFYDHLEDPVGNRLRESAIDYLERKIPAYQLSEMYFHEQGYDVVAVSRVCKAVSDLCKPEQLRLIKELTSRQVIAFVKHLILKIVLQDSSSDDFRRLVQESLTVAKL